MSNPDADLLELMKLDNTYPSQDDPEFQKKIYKKREFYYHKQPKRKEVQNYNEFKEERAKICGRKFALYEHQALLANFINPQTPYKGLLVVHGTGTGKCLHGSSRVNINDKYIPIKELWDKYYQLNNGLTYDDGEGEWLKDINLDKKMLVNAINEDSVQSIQPIKSLYRQRIRELVKIIKLKNGSQITTTLQHKFLTENGWQSDLTKIKYVMIPNKQHIIESESRDVIEKYMDDIKVNGNIYVDTNDPISLQYNFSAYGIDTIIDTQQNRLYIGSKNSSETGILCEIEKLWYEFYDGYVYDMEIDNVHSFIANGIYVSNTCLSITIAEQFKDMVQKYNTKICIIVPGPLIKESWKSAIIHCTGETYLKQQDSTVYISDYDREKQKKAAIFIALQYYRFMSYRSFYKKVLGEKIPDKIQTTNNKQKTTYRKDKEGSFERELALDRIDNLDNSLIIVDEAHSLTDNYYGEALSLIIKKSVNLRVLLLSATPMKNLASDIIELVNFLRPIDTPIERDKIFTSHKNHLMELKPGGLDYFKKMTKGYVSFYRGADPLTFAERVEMGEIPEGLLFTKLIRCRMLPFQQKIYNEVVNNVPELGSDTSEINEDALDRRSEAVANFAVPGLSDDRKHIKGFFGTAGIISIKNQIKSDIDLLNKKIVTDILGEDHLDFKEDLIQISDNGKSITGLILREKYLKNFSIKFYKAFKKIQRLFYHKKGARTAFVYSNLVKVGIELFQEILLQNGYLEYNESYSTYKIANDTICYYCGKTYLEHKQEKLKQAILSRTNKDNKENKENDGKNKKDKNGKKEKNNKELENKEVDNKDNFLDGNDSSSDYDNKGKIVVIPEHVFFPATFIVITGKSTDDIDDAMPEEKQHILDSVFSNIQNREGKFIKLVLGSKVMNEGINLKNVAEVHILDVYYNLGKVDQVIGRGIRGCSHYGIVSDELKYPKVKIYKYAVRVDGGLSSEEELYQKAEKKYLLVKKLEKAIKQVSFDCPINRHGNIFPEEVTKYKNCVEPGEPNPNGELLCPGVCGYTKCDFMCDEEALNNEYFDKENLTYKKLSMNELDYSTFRHVLMRTEIDNVKTKIKEMYRVKFDYTLDQILDYVQGSYSGEKRELFEQFFVFKALDEMIPITENDFNNFKDTVFNKFNQPGYLIYVNRYYIFQPFAENENIPMYYRSTFNRKFTQNLSLYNYIKHDPKVSSILKKNKSLLKTASTVDKNMDDAYNFDEGAEYYFNRKEYKIVGTIDKESSRKKVKLVDTLDDVFKIRKMRDKILEKKRGTGIPSSRGAVCDTANDKEYLMTIAKDLGINVEGNNVRKVLCDEIRDRLLFMEKYSTDEKKNKFTYIVIPSNHPVYKFPYNLEDRVKWIQDKIKDKIKFKIDMTTKKINSVVNGEDVVEFEIEIKMEDSLKPFIELFNSLGGEHISDKNLYKFIIN